MADGRCAVTLNIIDEQTATWSRDEAHDMMTIRLSTGEPFDGVISNNDEMAIGAILAIKAGGIDIASVVVGGVDITQHALLTMQAGDLDVMVFQTAAAQGSGGLSFDAKKRARPPEINVFFALILIIGIIALGSTQVIISHGIDLSPGSIVGLTAMVAMSFAVPSRMIA